MKGPRGRGRVTGGLRDCWESMRAPSGGIRVREIPQSMRMRPVVTPWTARPVRGNPAPLTAVAALAADEKVPDASSRAVVCAGPSVTNPPFPPKSRQRSQKSWPEAVGAGDPAPDPVRQDLSHRGPNRPGAGRFRFPRQFARRPTVPRAKSATPWPISAPGGSCGADDRAAAGSAHRRTAPARGRRTRKSLRRDGRFRSSRAPRLPPHGRASGRMGGQAATAAASSRSLRTPAPSFGAGRR